MNGKCPVEVIAKELKTTYCKLSRSTVPLKGLEYGFEGWDSFRAEISKEDLKTFDRYYKIGQRLAAYAERRDLVDEVKFNEMLPNTFKENGVIL